MTLSLFVRFSQGQDKMCLAPPVLNKHGAGSRVLLLLFQRGFFCTHTSPGCFSRASSSSCSMTQPVWATQLHGQMTQCHLPSPAAWTPCPLPLHYSPLHLHHWRHSDFTLLLNGESGWAYNFRLEKNFHVEFWSQGCNYLPAFSCCCQTAQCNGHTDPWDVPAFPS